MSSKNFLKWVEIDLRAIAANIRWVRSHLAPGTAMTAVVKADAYGHGAVPVARTALKEGAAALGVLTLDEAREIRAAFPRARIIVLCPPLASQAAEAVRLRVEPTVDSEKLAAALARAARGEVACHVDADFGLGRWGMAPKEVPAFLERLRRSKTLRPAGLSAHLDYVPGKNAVEAEDKLRLFSRLGAQARAVVPGIARHCANTSIFMDFPHWQMDMVRVGNLMYGINPTAKEAGLRKPWRLYARIMSLKEVGKGKSIGYGSEFIAPRRMRVAALPVGYADGLTMEPAQRLIGLGRGFHYWGWLKGKKVDFVGRSGISHVLVDVSGVPNASVGDPVSLPVRRTAASARLQRIYYRRFRR